jgi:7,8-dihydroneopterin aldolase/epimerase/oxygenase
LTGLLLVTDDYIFIRDFRCEAWIGIYEWEQAAPQVLEFNIEYGLPSSQASQSDSINDTINYGTVVERVRALLAHDRYQLLEKLAERVASLLTQELGAPWVKVSVAKINHVKGVARLGVSIRRVRTA